MGRSGRLLSNSGPPRRGTWLLMDQAEMIRLLARHATPGLVRKTQYTRLRGTDGVGAL